MEMRRKILILLLLVALVAAAKDSGNSSDLKCSNKTIAELGKDVTLDCYCEPRCDVTGEDLKWKFNQNTFVLAYRGTHDAKHQHAQFKGRAHVSSTERLKDGNFSVTISKVRKSDEGTYTCHVESKTCSVERKPCSVERKTCSVERKTCSVENKTCSVELRFKAGAQKGNTPTTSGAIIVIVAVIVVLVVGAALAAGLIYRYRKSLLSCIGTQRGGEQDDRRPSREGIELPSTTQNQERPPSEADPLTAPS